MLCKGSRLGNSNRLGRGADHWVERSYVLVQDELKLVDEKKRIRVGRRRGLIYRLYWSW
jgi:hypothetical protein